jgi:predicted dienelactone hydrolase
LPTERPSARDEVDRVAVSRQEEIQMSSFSSWARLIATSIPAMLVLAAPGEVTGDQTAVASTGLAADLRVGHSVEHLVVPGSRGESRAVDVHLWYPADQRGFSDAPRTFYKSRLWGVDLSRLGWSPLSWTVEAQLAREGVPIDPSGKPFPVIVFSHGSTNDPIDYAYTLEAIAGEGFVVAAPAHVNNTQDDVRIDFVNAQAALKGLPRLLPCNDGLPSPCVRSLMANLPGSMSDRVRDIEYVLDSLPGWYGDRVDTSRTGILGHSRGTVTALAAAGGSTAWGFGAIDSELEQPRIKAIMGLAIGGRAITFAADLAKVTVPTLLVAGMLDSNSTPDISEDAFETIESKEKAFVSIENAVHRSFDSTYCAQLQAAGAIAQANSGAVLDRHTVAGIVTAPISGVAMDYCPLASFTSPVDIRPLVSSMTGFDFASVNVPRTGLESEEVKEGVKELAVAFFGTELKRVGNDGPHFTRYLAPKWLVRHEPMVASAEVRVSGDAIYPPGQDPDRVGR